MGIGITYANQDESVKREATTFVLFNQDEDKAVILNIIEHSGEQVTLRGQKRYDSNKIPLIDKLGINSAVKIDVTISTGVEHKPDVFEVEEKDKSYYQDIKIEGISNINSKDKYQGDFQKIENVDIGDLIRGLQESNIKESRTRGDKERSDKKLRESLSPLAEALSPFKGLIKKEVDFQAIMQGLFINGKTEDGKEIRVYTESNLSSQGRMDLGLSFTQLSESDGSLIEDDPIIVELKYATSGSDASRQLKQAERQMGNKYKILRSFTDKKTAKHLAMVINNAAKNENDLIVASMKTVEVDHTSLSSGSDLSPDKKRKASCLPGPSSKRPRLNKRAVDGCLLDMDEDEKVNKESTGIEVNEENFDESKIDNEKLRAYQEKIKDEGNEINDQLNKLIIEIQQAQAFKSFSDADKVVREELFPALENIDGMQNENISYFEQMCKLNLLRIISPIIKDVDFKSLLFNNPEKLVKDQSLLENVFANVENLISNKYKQQQLQYEDFENLENQINEEILNKSGETEGIANQDVNKTDLLNYVFESIGLSLLMSQDTEVSIDLQKRVYYETLINLGSLIHDHKNHIQITHNGDQHTPHIDSLVERVKNSKLLSVAHDLYYLRKNEGNIDQSNLCSGEVKSKISLYGSINSEYKLNDIYNKFDIDEFKSYFSEDELKRFSAEFEAYNKEVITIHSTQVFTGGNGVHVKVRDKSGNVKQLIIGSIEDIKNIVNYDYNKETLEIKLKVASDKEYTITCEKRDGEVKYYLNIAGYKTKVGDIIKSFTTQAKGNIRRKLDQLQDKIELLTAKKYIEAMADIEVSDQDYIREVRQNLLAQGVSESTFDRFKEQLDYVNEEVFKKYVSNISEELTKNNIEFNNSKFNAAKVKGAKGNKFFSIMAIYDLLDSVKDVPTLGRHDNDALKRIFGINGILDAVNDVRESLSAVYMRSDGRVVTKIRPDSAMGRIFKKIPLSTRKAFVKVISNPVVESITFATVAYQFGHSIDAIVKGDHHPLNYYFATSNGIKLASMSMKPISMGVSAAVKGLSATSKALRAISIASKVLGKLSTITAVVDFAVTIGISIYEAVEYVKAVASQIPLSDIEQLDLFLSKIVNEGVTEKFYEDSAEVKAYLSGIVEAIANTLIGRSKRAGPDFDACLGGTKEVYKGYEIAAVVQYVASIVKKYSEVTQFDTMESCGTSRFSCHDGEICKFEERYVDVTFGSINEPGNLSSLDISKILPLTRGTLGGKEVYLVSSRWGRHLPHITLDEYNNGLRAIGMPHCFHAYDSTCGDIINEEYKWNGHYFSLRKNKCNIDEIYRNCTRNFILSGNPFLFSKREGKFHIVDNILEKPFIFANIKRSSSSPILYLSGPNQLIAAENYPAVMHIPKGRVDYKGSKYHDNTFIINYDTYGSVRGGTANNTIVMNYSPSAIFVRLDNGIIDAAGSEIKLVDIHNYISHSTANQNITTGCKTRYVDAGKGGGNNFIQSFDVGCQDKDYEVREVNGKDVHSRSTKQATFIIDQNSGSGATISFGDLKSKENLDVIYVKSFDISQLRINEHQNGYRLNFVTDEEVRASVRIDSFEKLVTKMGTAVTIVIRDKSLPDIIKDMVRQKLSHTGADIDDKIIENSKKRSKAVIIADITGSENTTAYAVARGIAESSDNLGITVSQIQVIKGDIVLNYAVNDLNQIKLIPNNGTNISDEAKGKYENLLLTAEGNGDVNKARDSLKKGASIEAKNRVGTPLHVLTWENGPFSVIRFLVDQGANIEAENDYKNRPLHHAAYTSRPDVVRYFVEKGANISAKDNNNKTPLERANGNRKSEIVNFLRKKQSEYDRDLLTAASNGDIDKVRDLLNRGANIEAVNGDKSTPLHCAAWHSRLNVAKLLFDRGAKIEAKDINNSTPLLYAIQGNKSVDLVEFLVDKGANISVKNDLDQTPLGEANKLSNPEIANFLREKQNERPVQRKRRHHHGDHPRHHSGEQKYLQREERSIEPKGASRNIENINSAIEGNQQATSGASKPLSWINVFANTIVDAVKGVSQFISSPFKPAIGMEHSQLSKAATTQGTDVNGTLFLLDVFIRKITGQKYISTADQPTISLPEAVFYASDIINGFEKAVEQAASKSGMSMHRLNINFVGMEKEIAGKIIGGKFGEILRILKSYVEKACPSREAGCPGKLSPKKFDKFMTTFNNRINITLDESILQILHSEHNKSKVKNIEEQQRNLKDKKQPRSYLDDSSVQGLLTQAVVSK